MVPGGSWVRGMLCLKEKLQLYIALALLSAISSCYNLCFSHEADAATGGLLLSLPINC